MSSDLGIPYAGDRLDEPATRSPACPACGRHSQAEAAFLRLLRHGARPSAGPGPPCSPRSRPRSRAAARTTCCTRWVGSSSRWGGLSRASRKHRRRSWRCSPPKEDAAVTAARAAPRRGDGLSRTSGSGSTRPEVTERSDQDAIWQYLIDRAAELQALAQPGTIVPGDEILPLTEGAAVIEPLADGKGTPSLCSIRDLAAASAGASDGDRVDADRADPIGAAPRRPLVGRGT